MSHHTAALMGSRRFAPLFWAQFLASFNDNFLKNALVMMIAYKGLTVFGLKPDAMGTLAPAVFIAPYFLFSAIAGQLADRAPKAQLISQVKLVEIVLAVVASYGFMADKPQLLLVSLFLLGVQATFFGPLKYSVLPQLLAPEELVAGNALVEMGTNMGILVGTLLGGILIAQAGTGPLVVSGGMLGVAVVGWLATRFIPATPAQAPDLQVSWNPFTTTWQIVAHTARQRPLFNAILAISWFWLFGLGVMGLFVPFAKNFLHADENVVTLFLAIFSVGVGLGSLVCERLSFGRLELGLVPFGSIGLTVFALDMALAGGLPAASYGLTGVGDFLSTFTGVRLAIDMFGIAFSGGVFSVPLYTFLQTRSNPEERSRVIAANNIMNAVFMVGWAGIQIGLLEIMPVPGIFALVAVLNALVAVYIYTVIPEFTLRFVAYMLTRLIYRCKVTGLEHIPAEGPAVLVCNHVSFIDWLIIAGAVKRPVRFVMYYGFAKGRLARAFFQQAKVIPIASAKEDPQALEAAMDRVAQELADGELVCIFPEGHLTGDGSIDVFRGGIERIVARTPVPVVPMALAGLWGGFFSRKDGAALTHPFRRFWSRIFLNIGVAVPAAAVTAPALREDVLALRGDLA